MKKGMANVMTSLSWDAGVVVDETIRLLKSEYAPAEVVVGMDGKFLFAVLRMVPSWVHEHINWMAMSGYPLPRVVIESKK